MATTDKILQLTHYKNSLIFSEVVICSAIELKFKGIFIGESLLSDSWYIATNNNRIICISFAGDQQVSELFTFQGNFRIIGIKIVNSDLSIISCPYQKLDIDYFNQSREVFSSAGSYFSDYDSTHEAINTLDDVDIYKNNLMTKQNEFYYENGDNYYGSYHQHSNGQAMSESSHTIDSVPIFRKDKNNKLYKPKPKRLKVITALGEHRLLRDEEEKSKYIQTRGASGERTGTGGGTGGGGTGGY